MLLCRNKPLGLGENLHDFFHSCFEEVLFLKLVVKAVENDCCDIFKLDHVLMAEVRRNSKIFECLASDDGLSVAILN